MSDYKDVTTIVKSIRIYLGLKTAKNLKKRGRNPKYSLLLADVSVVEKRAWLMSV